VPTVIDRHVLPKKWVHSHEEDTDDTMVFRPDSHVFPPSRGRRSFELRPDGTMTNYSIGPDDRPGSRSGSWDLAESNQLELRPDDPKAGATVMRMLQAAPDKLVIEK
jgi:hypothetical protein